MLTPDHEYIVIQTKKPMNMLMKYADSYMFSKETSLGHQYYFDTTKWNYECVKEHRKIWEGKEYLVMNAIEDNFQFSVLLTNGSCQMFFVTAN